MSDDLVKQRKVTEGEVCPDASSLIKWVVETELANRIEQLEERLENEMQDLDAADRRAKRLQNRIEELEAKLAACEKYRDAYAECDRIGTQSVRELEAKLAKAVEALGVLIQLAHDCEKELTEELHRQDFCGESLPLTNARVILAELKGEKVD